MSTTIIMIVEAERQLEAAIEWWDHHRSAARGLVLDEFEACLRLLEIAPRVGVRFRRTNVPGVRRLLMRRSRNHIYYVRDPSRPIIYVIAIWGAAKGRPPSLRDPRA